MYNFDVKFSNPFVLILIVISFLFMLYLYLKQSKKFRNNRNNIISKLLGLSSMILITLIISGMTISYNTSDVQNEVFILVDTSHSSSNEKTNIDKHVYDAIESNDKNCLVGVITFGKNQVIASNLSNDKNQIYYDYVNSDAPDNSASDIDSALNYTNSLFSNSELGKILLITDGVQTDGDSLNTAKSLSLLGVIIDVIPLTSYYEKNDVYAVSLGYPDSTISSNEKVLLELSISSTISSEGTISIYDNDELQTNIYTKVNLGTNVINFEHIFTGNGLHEIRIEIDFSNDENKLNNILYSYTFINQFDKILILQRSNESDIFSTKLSDDLNIDILNIKDVLVSIDELRKYDQIILMNIANADMPIGFIQILNSYVSDYGGGLLTIGGVKEEFGESVANVYNREDMSGTLYESMLPVNAVDYVPPIAVMLVIDSSSSMSDSMQGAKESAIACLDSLDDRDYVGIITYSDKEKLILPPTPMTNKGTIINAIYSITTAAGSTVYTGALKQAGTSLKAVNYVNKKHIIMISDGQPGDSRNEYLSVVEDNLKSNITTSVIAFGTNSYVMEEVSIYGDGYYYTATDKDSLTEALKKDLSVPEIREFVYETFQPEFGVNSYIFNGVSQEEMPTLEGFFGTKLKSYANNILMGEYGQPIYATWNYGRGSVGSFMCDLNGFWSNDFLNSVHSETVLNAMIKVLFPSNLVANSDIVASAKQNNCYIDLTLSVSLNQEDYLAIIIREPNSNSLLDPIYLYDIKGIHTEKILIDKPGIYTIEIKRYDKYGTELSSITMYQDFSYSLEYNPLYQSQDTSSYFSNLIEYGNGSLLTDSTFIYNNLQEIHSNVLNPSSFFAVLVIIFLLCEVAIRKFKIKYPWEIYKEKYKK